jgi:hypothetical protein
MIITLEIGDWSRDGHNQSEKIAFDSNLSVNEIKDAYKRGVDSIGFDLEDCCAEYESRTLSDNRMELLEEAGFVFESEEILPQVFADMYIFFCRTGNPSIEIKPIELANITIGGYGLFS